MMSRSIVSPVFPDRGKTATRSLDFELQNARSDDENLPQILLNAEVEAALGNALLVAQPGSSLVALANHVYDHEPELMARLARPWTVTRLMWLLSRQRRREADSGQLLLPGFEKLPRRIETKEGRFLLREATLLKLIRYREILEIGRASCRER